MEKMEFYFVAILILLLVIYSCKDDEINSSNLNSIELVSYKSNGCTSALKSSNTDQTNDDEVIIETNYAFGSLEVKLNFSTLCSAEMKDSIQVDQRTLWIFLADTNKVASRCVCPHKEEFLFKMYEQQILEIKFSYKSIASTDYYLIADTTIGIN